MIPSPYLLLAKIGLIGVLLAGVFGYGHYVGSSGVQSRWDSEKAQTTLAIAKLKEDHAAENAKVQQDNELRSINAEKKHEQDLDALNQKYLAASNSGLRIPSTACNSVAPPTSAQGSSDTNEASTIRLPPETERRLFDLAKSADQTSLQLLALQQWIIDSGLYPKD